MGIYTDIEVALNSRLQDSGITNIAWPNKKYTPSENQFYIRPVILPAATKLYTLNRVQQHLGIYQINVFVPLEKGVQTLNTILDDLENHFSADLDLTAGTSTVFIQASGRGPSEKQESWYVGSISINYLCYK